MYNIDCRTVGIMDENCYMVSVDGRDDCILIDPGSEAEKITEMVGNRKISAILLTHGHFDHIGAVDEIISSLATTCPVYVAAPDVTMIKDSEINASWMVGKNIVCSSATTEIKNGDTISSAGMEIEVISSSGHTQGSVCYKIGNHLFSGDTVFSNGYVGRTDLPGGSDDDMMLTLEKLKPMLKNVILHGGH